MNQQRLFVSCLLVFGLITAAGALTVHAQGPTETPTVTATPTQQAVQVNVVDLQFVRDTHLQVVGASWAVMVLFVLAMVAGGDKMKNLTALLVLELAASPLMLINAALWAMSIYIFFCLFAIVQAIKGAVG